ncbi:MAG: hypothetical protein EOM40_07150 [Clostridia bacterium]|nr:hypothetical protein [Clostridia bacterium]NCC42339.1 hypothetical protein [Clostridia bacterium]
MRSKKKIVLLTSILLLTSAIMGTGTFAFITARLETTNVITTGSVDLKIVETRIDINGNEEAYPETTIGDIVPGAVVSKIPRLSNIGHSDSWMRAKTDIQILSQDGTNRLESSVITLDFNSNWINGNDGWYYYSYPVKSGEKTEPLFTQVSFSEVMADEYAGANVDVNVIGESVQIKNNADKSGNVLEANGWPSDTP